MNILNTIKKNLFTRNSLIIFVLAFIFITIGVYFYTNNVSKTLDPDYVENKELQNGTQENSECELFLFYTDWCPYCVKAKPIWNQLKNDYQNKLINNTVIHFKDIDRDQHADMAEEYEVEGVPTIILVKDGQKILYDAKVDYDNLLQFLHQYL